MSNLEKLVDCSGEVINVAVKIFVEKQGVWNVLQLTDEVAALGTIKKEELLSELAACTPEFRKLLDKQFQDKVVLANKSLEAKIEKGELVLEKGIDLVLKTLSLYNDGKALVAEMKALVA